MAKAIFGLPDYAPFILADHLDEVEEIMARRGVYVPDDAEFTVTREPHMKLFDGTQMDMITVEYEPAK